MTVSVVFSKTLISKYQFYEMIYDFHIGIRKKRANQFGGAHTCTESMVNNNQGTYVPYIINVSKIVRLLDKKDVIHVPDK